MFLTSHSTSAPTHRDIVGVTITCRSNILSNISLGKGRLPSAQTLLVVTNMKFGANEISVTFIIKLNVLLLNDEPRKISNISKTKVKN